ncbi:MAG: sigma-70 family RNA polymerase sigma factor [Micromonosporaceae bacterium]|nr:sigma-70 family RNA polymerase sigma factor [Micromonosporaceae bacterium]
MPTGDLVERVRAGDQGAWRALTRRCTPLLWSVARTLRLSREDGADAIQTTWLRLVERIDTIRDPERIAGWLSTTMRNECLAVLRRQARQLPTQDWDLEPDPGDPLDAALLRDERDAQLWQAFGKLGKACQRLLWALLVDPQPSYAEVAEALGMPIGSIGPTRQRCLASLRRLLAESAARDEPAGESA